MTSLRSEEDEDVTGQRAGGDRMNVLPLPECLFEVLLEMLRPLEPMDLITTSPSNGLVDDSYHDIILSFMLALGTTRRPDQPNETLVSVG